jgi:hypothetical protein
MNAFPQRVVEVHIVNIKTITVKNLVMKILVLGMVSMTVSEMVVEVVVVVGMLIMMISVEEDMDRVVVCTLMMKRKFIMIRMKDLMIMKTLLLATGGLDSAKIAVEVLVMMEDSIVVVTIGMIRTALLESS